MSLLRRAGPDTHPTLPVRVEVLPNSTTPLHRHEPAFPRSPAAMSHPDVYACVIPGCGMVGWRGGGVGYWGWGWGTGDGQPQQEDTCWGRCFVLLARAAAAAPGGGGYGLRAHWRAWRGRLQTARTAQRQLDQRLLPQQAGLGLPSLRPTCPSCLQMIQGLDALRDHLGTHSAPTVAPGEGWAGPLCFGLRAVRAAVAARHVESHSSRCCFVRHRRQRWWRCGRRPSGSG